MRVRAIDVVSPEGVGLQLELAGVLERAFALFIDIIIIALVTAAFVPATLVGTGFGVVVEGWAIVLLGVFVIRHGYFAFFEIYLNGATPGKLLMSVRVIARDGGSLSTSAVLARNLLRDVELFLPVVIVLAPEQLVGESPAWLWIPASGWVVILAFLPLISRERTRAGDLVGGTVVIRIPKAVLLEDEASRVSRQPMAFTPEQLSVYGEHELETLATVLRKADAGKANDDDLRVISMTIARKVGYDGPEPYHEPARFLRSFYKRQRASLEKKLLLGKRKASKLDE